MTTMIRMGAQATLAPDPGNWGRATVEYVTVNSAGNETGRFTVDDDAEALALNLVHFVDLADGRRITTEHLGAITLITGRDIGIDELRDEIRETIFDDEAREVDDELAAEPRWPDMAETLAAAGVAADDEALEALPFVVELDDEVASMVSR
jgi:hypothetical protein